MSKIFTGRRRFFTGLLGAGAGLTVFKQAQAEEFRFPGDDPEHFVVYQINKADHDYQNAILNSMSAMIGKYGDNIQIAGVAFGPGVHLLAKEPKREIDSLLYDRVRGFHENNGVEWVACGNTMDTVGYTAEDMRDFAKIEQVGAAALMEYQEQGYAYITW